ncbi:YgfZ/GcvT domain-containing protein [Acuticoccus sp.]|uniref:CAF17-like 4Fe-4S cluster assembly/insertion protein YgfZ n=1 Tax=Acuticoccus sp. TaxID=1904378 RepID=UPI003B52445B
MGILSGRSVVSVSGADRLAFLDGLVSCRTATLRPGDLAYGALLTPQGKVVTDLFAHALPDRVALDVPSSIADDLQRRLSLYKLRAAVTVERTDERVVVGEGPADPRADGLGGRAVASVHGADDDEEYHAARIAAGVPDAVLDFELGDAFPHDANMDLTGGVDFAKGCFVGQEVVSRMRHRGTARRRTVIAAADAPLESGAPVSAGGRVVGRLGTVVGRRGLALVRIDRTGSEADVGGTRVRLSPPPGAPFALAEPTDAGTDA